MSSLNGDNINLVEQVTTAQQNLSLEDPSQVRAVADAAPVSTNAPDRVMSIPFRKEGWPEDWREKDSHTSLKSKKRAKPIIPPTARDPRKLELINDVFTASAAYKGTAKIFPRETELSRAGDKMAWVEGQMLGEADEKTKAPISASQDFIPPRDFTDTCSSGSRGHRIAHSPPTAEVSRRSG
ncbi:hypothetical protein FMUND_10920 [Fusarium mundagurra]|uniref:Uncharacterized protein n=1 Tax=Fusarium mundagurra TaxID=1567541 RepID=A0A8H6D806_9HYPO|nr:hypothetical protein FMUND_10920 [Fusarium mundagurra]